MTPEVPYPLHKPEPPASYVEEKSRRRRRWGLVASFCSAAVDACRARARRSSGSTGAVAAADATRPRTFSDPVVHFAHGSIGADEGSGLPYWVWKALPRLFPEQFNGRLDYSAFGFLYLRDADGRPHDLPLGISKRNYQGVDLVWFNCAVCHVGTWRTSETAEQHLVAGMPANNLDIYRFIKFVLDAGVDERLAAETLIPAMQQAGAKLDLFERLVWKFYVIPRVREGFIQRRTRLAAFMADQKPWGPGRVDTFNPYKLVQMQDPQRCARRRGAQRRERLPGDLQSGARAKAWSCIGTATTNRSTSATSPPRSARASRSSRSITRRSSGCATGSGP